MIAYKGTEQLKCQTLKYEVGKTYIFDGDIELCCKGFHACRNIIDVHRHYNFDVKDTVILEVEIPEDAKIIDATDDSKFVTDKLEVLRILTKKDIEKISNGNVKFDENGNLVYIRYGDRRWKKYKYDKNGNVIYYEDSGGYWEKVEYDENGNKVYYKNSNGFWAKREFDERGALIYFEDSGGHWWKRKFDNDGNEIYYEDNTGYQRYQNMWLIEDQNKIRGSV